MVLKKAKKTLTNEIKHKKLNWFYYIPLLAAIAVVPLIVRGKYLELEGVQALFWKGLSYNLDLYSYWKSWWFVFASIASLIVYIGLCVDKKLSLKIKNEKKYYIPMVIYFIFVLISSITSFYPEVVWGGFVDLHQGLFVLISYILMTFLTINYVNNESDLELFAKAFILLIIVEGILCLGQYFGLDYMKSNLVLKLVVPRELIIESSNYIFGEYTMYGTMYNTNFIGSFASIIVPLAVSFLIIAKSKKSKIISGIALFLAGCMLIGCNSRAGYLGLIVVMIVSCIYLRKQIIKNYKFTLTLTLGLVFIVIAFNTVSGGRILGQFSRLNLFKEIETLEQANENVQNIDTGSIVYKDIKLSKDSFSLVTNKDSLTVKYVDNKLSAYDSQSNELNMTYNDDGYIYIDDEKYKGYKLKLLNENDIELTAYDRPIEFYLTDTGFKIIGCGNRLTEPIVADRFKLLDGYDKFASGRGYIWSRSLMMLPKVIFKGYGPDTYAVVFPQDDFLAKLNAGMDANTVVDKPHNMYLQIAINTGIISLVALLSLWGIYLISSLKLYKNMLYDTREKCIGFACFMAVLGYLVAGLFNDQIISVAPLFWITLGLGISINERLKIKD